MDAKHCSQFESKRIRLFLFFAGLVLGALCRLATGQQTVPVTGNMVDGSNNPVPGAYLHFDLYNCGPNYPMIGVYTITGSIDVGPFTIGEQVKQGVTNVTATLLSSTPFVIAGLSSSTADATDTWVGQTSHGIFVPSSVPKGSQIIVQRSFDLQQNSSGLISGTVVPNDLIFCGNVTSTQWTVTPMKSGATPLNAAQRYFICSIAASGTPPCAQSSAGGTFDPSNAQPAQISPQPPGYSLLYANPLVTQQIDQPVGTQFNWLGTVNFCSATVLCGGSGSGDVNPGPEGDVAYYPGPGTTSTVSPQSNITFSGNTTSFPNGPVQIGASPPTACGTATGCLAAPTSGGSVSPTAGQNTMRFGSSQLLCSINGGAEAACLGGSGGGGNPSLDNCTPDQTGNSFYSVTGQTSYFYASWQFVYNTTTYINCTVYFSSAQTGQTITLVIATDDATTSHTANFQTCDAFVTATGSLNPGSLTCASAQTFTVPGTSYNAVTLTFNVQSTISGAGVLIVKILTTPSGTAPTANLLVYPTFQ